MLLKKNMLMEKESNIGDAEKKIYIYIYTAPNFIIKMKGQKIIIRLYSNFLQTCYVLGNCAKGLTCTIMKPFFINFNKKFTQGSEFSQQHCREFDLTHPPLLALLPWSLPSCWYSPYLFCAIRTLRYLSSYQMNSITLSFPLFHIPDDIFLPCCDSLCSFVTYTS